MICPHCKGEFIVTVEEFVKHVRNCDKDIQHKKEVEDVRN